MDFAELQLKSRDDFGAAYDINLTTKLFDYIKRYLLRQPGDWPAQFYSHQLVYETLQKYWSHFPSSEPSPILKAKCAGILSKLFVDISRNIGEGRIIFEGQKKSAVLPKVFGKDQM